MSSLTVQERIQECREKQLDILDLGNYGLTAVPKEVFELTDLRRLNLGSRFYEEGAWKASKNKKSSNSISEIPHEIAKLKKLEELSLEENQVQDFEFLKKLPNLFYLNIGGTKIKSLEILHELPGLKALNLRGLKLNSLTKIENLPFAELISLDISQNNLRKIEGLNAFLRLKHLNLSHNKIQQIENLNHLKELKSLYLGLNFITKINKLEKLIKLEILSFGYLGVNADHIRDYYRSNLIQNIENLEPFHKLKRLDLSGNLISEITGLNSLLKLETLYLGFNQIGKIQGIKHLKSLRNLSFGFETKDYSIIQKNTNQIFGDFIPRANKIQSIEALGFLKDLEYFSLDRNQIGETKGLEGLINLHTLRLSSNQISEIKGLEGLINLHTLYLSSNQISEIKGLEGLINLHTLELSSNQISEIKGLEGLINLHTLYLSSNQISEIKGLEGLINLHTLELDSNQISEIKGLEGLINLHTLYLSSNQISEIKGLEGLIYLHALWLSSNQISEIKGLEGLINLHTLRLYSNQISEVKGLGGLINLHTLYLESNQISEIKGLEGLINLHSLELDSNQISEIKGLEGLINLHTLYLYSNQISEIKGLEGLINLHTLYLYSNQISEIKGLEGLINLHTLYLSSNQISEIKGLEGLINLHTLELYSNQISEIKGLEELINLHSLRFDSNQISEIKGLEELINLHSLRLDSNQISEIQGLDSLTNLNRLDIDINQISEIKGLEGLINLHTLYLSSNQISEIKGLEGLINLHTLYLSSNQISEIKGLEGLINLHTLYLSSNQISKNKGLEGLINLHTLRLDSNQISEIKVLEGLINLHTLRLDSNQISEIKGLGMLMYLTDLDTSNNPLENIDELIKNKFIVRITCNDSHLPNLNPELLKIPNLMVLSSKNNPFRNIPSEIINQTNCLVDARIWFRDLAKESIANYEAKLMIIGNGRVGKTSILKKIFLDEFDEKEDSTHGIKLYRFERKVDSCEEPLEINSWDFGGQEIYHATHRLFMQSRALYLCLWDLQAENKKFERQKIAGKEVEFRNHKLTYWLDHARSLSWKSPLIVSQNKIDIDGPEWPDNSMKLQKRYEILNFFQVSASTGDSINVLKSALFDQFAKMPEVGMKTPAQWMRVKSKLIALKETDNIIPYSRYKKICQEEKLRVSSNEALIRFLHNTGTLFYHGHLFKNQIILNQEWALEGLYAVFQRGPFFKQLKKAKGHTSLESLGLIWNDYKIETRKVFLSMMESCEICFKVNEDDKDPEYIITEYLADEKSEQLSRYWESASEHELFLRYQTNFFHKAFISRFIAQVGRLAKNFDHIWQYGIWLTFDNSSALVEAFPDKHQILIRVKGNHAILYLYLIHKTFKEIFYNPESVEMEISIAGNDYLPYEDIKEGKITGEKKILSTSKNWIDLEKVSFFTQVLEARSEEEVKRKLMDLVPKPPLKVQENLLDGEGLLDRNDFFKLKSKLKKEITRDLEIAFEHVNHILLESNSKKELFLDQGRYSDLNRFYIKGQVDIDDFSIKCNAIRMSLMMIIDKIQLKEIDTKKVLEYIGDDL